MQSGTQGSLGGSSLPLRTAQVSFDVTKESEVIALLKFIHQNPIDSETKNKLRDFIFAFRQDFSQSSFEALKALCVAIGVNVTHEQVATSPKPIHAEHMRFNEGRPLPSFAVATKQPPLPAAVSASEPSASVSVPLRKIVVPVFEVTVPAQTVAESVRKEVVEEKVPSIPTPTPVPQSAPVDIATAQARISEIKHLVNGKVGNPVNLIDAHNEVGRLYMNALLDAMKKANGGVQGELTLAMGLLEEAYTQVLHALEGKPVVVPVSTTKQSAEPVVQTVQSAVIPQSSLAPRIVSSVVSSEASAPRVSEEQRVKEMQEKLSALQSRVVEAKQKQTPTSPTVPPIPITSVPTYTPPVEPYLETNTRPIPTRTTAVDTGGLHSVAKNKQLQDLLRSNREKEIVAQESKEQEAVAKMDPTETPEVTAGLSQLLSEWSLFRSSGFFGTGPSGKDHVLYQKLGGLTMAAVIAGRFEGSTPLIKQSIADYMNGWRYEEGIIHEHGETFEHYLRKVVYHIIEKKKKAIVSHK